MSTRDRRTARWLLLPSLLLLLATSRPLAIKELTGTAALVPAGLAVVEAPTATFGENTNNQGCFAQQRLDLRVRAQVRNDGEATVTIREGDAELVLDGARRPLEPHTYSVGGERTVVPFGEHSIEPGETGEVIVFSYAFMPMEGFEEVEQIEISLPVGGQRLRLVFSDVASVDAVMR